MEGERATDEGGETRRDSQVFGVAGEEVLEALATGDGGERGGARGTEARGGTRGGGGAERGADQGGGGSPQGTTRHRERGRHEEQIVDQG